MSLTRISRSEAIEFLTARPAEYGHLLGFTKLTGLHNTWIKEMLEGRGDLTIQASRGTYKTTCVSLTLALMIILLPEKRTIFLRKTDDDVKEVMRQVANILQSPVTQTFVNAIYDVNPRLTSATMSEISTNLNVDTRGTPQLIGSGIHGSLTGKHADRIFTDDIVNVKDRTSRSERESTKLAYMELQNIKNRGGRIINTGTPWHKDDAFNLMPNLEKYDCYNEQIAEIISKAELQDLRDSMSPSLFAANYELRHIASEDVIFTMPETGADLEEVTDAPVCHVDAAYGGEDWTALTIAKKSRGRYFLLGKIWHKHVDQCMDDILAVREIVRGGRIYCEKNADKGYLAKAFRERGIRVVCYNESTNKYMKIVTHLKGDWQNVTFVKGTDDEYLQQILDFNEFAEHDDAPDSAACAVRVLHGRKNAEDEENGGFGY